MLISFKRALAISILIVFVFHVSACSNYKNISAKQYETALKKADVGADNTNIKLQKGGNFEYVGFQKGDNLDFYVAFTVYDNDLSSRNMFQAAYERYVKGVESSSFSGNSKKEVGDNFSYFTLNGKTSDDTFSTPAGYYYGGWYQSKYNYAIVYTMIDTDNARAEIDRILKQLGYPTP